MSGLKHKVLETDVLVIGGGGAAARAALEADERGAKVTMILKGVLGESGSTASHWSPAGYFQAAIGHADASDNPDLHFLDIINGALGLADEKLARIVAEEAPKRFFDLVRWGVPFEKIGEKFVQKLGCYSTRPRMCITKDHGSQIMAALKDVIEDRKGIDVMEKTMATSLLKHKETCVGATCIDEKGDFLVLKAKSTILATGGANGQLFLLSLMAPDTSGDGYAMAFHAGAELVNMEFFQTGFGLVYPKKTLLLPWGFWNSYPKICNAVGETFIEKYLPEEVELKKCLDLRSLSYPFTSRNDSKYVDVAIYQEILAGRGTDHLGVYADFRELPEETLMKDEGGRRNIEFFESHGINLTKDVIEVSTFAQSSNGGLRINEKAETTLRGLYAAGEAAGGPHGAERLGGNMLATCQVFGARAGQYGAERSKKMGSVKVDEGQVEKEYKRVIGILERESAVTANEVKNKIQETMWRNALVSKNQRSVERAMDDLQNLKKHLSKLSIGRQAELFEAIAVPNLIDVGQIILTAALLRKESRGNHFRDDYPFQDDKNWLRNIVLKKERDQIRAYRVKFPKLQ